MKQLEEFFIHFRTITKCLLEAKYLETLEMIEAHIDEPLNLRKDVKLELLSIKSQALMQMARYEEAEVELNNILKEHPLHFLSLKRRAALYQKMNRIPDAIEDYNKCSFLDSESRNIRSRIKKLQAKQEQVEQEKMIKSQNSKEESEGKSPVVRFGSFQVIEVMTEDSDEHFAVIKQQISRLSQTKPKKSILKDSLASSFSTFNSGKSHSSAHSDKEIAYKEKPDMIADGPIDCYPSNDSIEQPEEPPKTAKKVYSLTVSENKKKKCKSVTFKVDSQGDFDEN